MAAALGACGRMGFDARVSGDASDAGSDAPGGGTADGNESLCASSSALICDGFTQATLDPRWTPDTTSASIGVDGARAYRGTRSLHASTNTISSSTTNPHASIVTYDGLGGVTGIVYTRAWVYIPVGFPTTEFAQVLNFADGAGLGISLGTRNGFLVNNDYTIGAYKQSATAPLPLGRWACLQMEMPSNSTATARVFLDGAEITDIAIARTSTQPAPTHVYTGLTWIGDIASLPASEVWIDEILVDTSPTSCAQ
jgi:hypothetical protein